MVVHSYFLHILLVRRKFHSSSQTVDMWNRLPKGCLPDDYNLNSYKSTVIYPAYPLNLQLHFLISHTKSHAVTCVSLGPCTGRIFFGKRLLETYRRKHTRACTLMYIHTQTHICTHTNTHIYLLFRLWFGILYSFVSSLWAF